MAAFSSKKTGFAGSSWDYYVEGKTDFTLELETKHMDVRVMVAPEAIGKAEEI